MTSIQIILYCHNKNKKNKSFIAPITILKQFEQEKISYTIEKDIITIMNKKFRIERGQEMLINIIFFTLLLPFEAITLKWIIKTLIQEFKNMED